MRSNLCTPQLPFSTAVRNSQKDSVQTGTVEATCVLRNFPFQRLCGTVIPKTVSKQELLKQLVYSATSLFKGCAEQSQRQCAKSNCWSNLCTAQLPFSTVVRNSHKDSVQTGTVEATCVQKGNCWSKLCTPQLHTAHIMSHHSCAERSQRQFPKSNCWSNLCTKKQLLKQPFPFQQLCGTVSKTVSKKQLLKNNSAARQLREPSSTSLLMISDLCSALWPNRLGWALHGHLIPPLPLFPVSNRPYAVCVNVKRYQSVKSVGKVNPKVDKKNNTTKQKIKSSHFLIVFNRLTVV